MKIRPIALTCAGALTATLAGCGGSPAATASHGSGAGSAANSDTGDCLLGANGADVEVGIASPTQTCGQWITNLAGIGLNWIIIPQLVVPGSSGTADSDTMAEVCDLTSGGQELYVEDGGDAMYGNTICSQEEQNGWQPENSPGPLAAQGQQQARAQGRASANLASEQQAHQDLQALQGAGGQVTQDMNQMQGDVSTAGQDLATVRADVSAGQGSYCVGVSQAEADAAGVSAQVSGTVGADQTGLQSDVTSLRSAIQAVQNDLNNLNASGLPAPGGLQATLSAAQQQVQQTVSQANGLIDQANGDQVQADNSANSLVSGACSTSGEAAPSPAVAHIS